MGVGHVSMSPGGRDPGPDACHLPLSASVPAPSAPLKAGPWDALYGVFPAPRSLLWLNSANENTSKRLKVREAEISICLATGSQQPVPLRRAQLCPSGQACLH